MTLDRDAARALFDSADPMPAAGGGSAFATTSPFAPADNDASARMSGGAQRGRIDWRLVAPVGVAALCAGAALLLVTQRDPAEPGRTVAATEATQPLPTPLPAPAPLPEPVETAAATPAPVIAPPAARPAPVVRARTAPARRATPEPRTVATAPSAADASSNVSAREPYVPPPSLGAPVTITPVAPAPAPAPAPMPEPVTPPQ